MPMVEVAAVVVECFAKIKISAIMVGGSVVSIYSDNQYQSKNIDFISSGDHRFINLAMSELGFKKQKIDFIHPDTEFSIKFPAGPLALGEEVPVNSEGEIQILGVKIQLLSPTQSIMDRLTNFFYFHDRECLDHALLIYQHQQKSVDIPRIQSWSENGGETEKFEVFLNRLT